MTNKNHIMNLERRFYTISCFVLVFILLNLFALIIDRRSGSANPTECDLVNLRSLLKASIYAAERGGKKVLRFKDAFAALNVKSKWKMMNAFNDSVTVADISSHCAMYYTLKNTFPKLSIVSEEGPRNYAECTEQEAIDLDSTPPAHGVIDYMFDESVNIKDVTVWIDPLDATQEYTEGLYKYVTTMVCVAIKGVPIIGVIHQPFTPGTYWGWFTKRTSDNFPTVVYNEYKKYQPTIAISRSHPDKVMEMAKEAFGWKTTVKTAGGAGYKVMGVANGTYDVYLHATAIKKWDLCAGDAIIKSVDGKITTVQGEYIDYSTDSEVKVTEGILVTRYDHDYYLSKMPSILSSLN